MTGSVATTFLLLLLQLCQASHSHLRQPHQHQQERDLAAMSNRIVGGRDVTQSYPYFIEWQDRGCGGTLIHDDIMLTAAHCHGVNNAFNRVVQIGGTRINTGKATRTMTLQIPHPDFTFSDDTLDLRYDVMVVKLNASVLIDSEGNATEGVNIIPYNKLRNRPSEGASLKILGYGLEDPTAFYEPDILQQATVYAWSDTECYEAYKNTIFSADTDVMFCANDRVNERDSCQGDSGGPIVDIDNQVLVGVTSFGESCGSATFPGVYARVSAVQEWIHHEICTWSCYPPPDCPPDIVPNSCFDHGGDLNLTLVVQFDKFPSETAILVEHLETASELLHIPYETYDNSLSPTPDNLYQHTYTFENQPNGTFRIVLGDTGRDGICCRYGQGNLTLYNTDTGEELFFSNGTFGSTLDETVQVGNFTARDLDPYQQGIVGGGATTEEETPPAPTNPPVGSGGDGSGGGGDSGIGIGVGTGGSGGGGGDGDGGTSNVQEPSQEEEFEVGFLEPSEYDYIVRTGLLQYPDAGSTNALVINFQFDQYSWDEQDWGVELFDVQEQKWFNVARATWIYVDQFFAYLMTNLPSSALLRFYIEDSFEDGLEEHGWVVITNSTATTDNPDGTIMWVLRGEDFTRSAEAHIWVDENGHTNILREAELAQYTTPGGAASEAVQQQQEPFIEVAAPGQSVVTGERIQRRKREQGRSPLSDVVP